MKCRSNPKPHLLDACENLGAPGSKNPLRFAPRLPRDCGTTCTSSTAPTVPVSVNIARGCAATPLVSRAGVVGSISARTHALTRSTSPAHEPVTSFCLPPHARGPRGLRPADQPRPAQSTRGFKRRNGTACDNCRVRGSSERLPGPPEQATIYLLDDAAEHCPRRRTDREDDPRREAGLRGAQHAPPARHSVNLQAAESQSWESENHQK